MKRSLWGRSVPPIFLIAVCNFPSFKMSFRGIFCTFQALYGKMVFFCSNNFINSNDSFCTLCTFIIIKVRF